MCFGSKSKTTGQPKPTSTPVEPNPNNAPAANPDLSQQRTAATSTTTPNDPLGQAQLGN